MIVLVGVGIGLGALGPLLIGVALRETVGMDYPDWEWIAAAIGGLGIGPFLVSLILDDYLIADLPRHP